MSVKKYDGGSGMGVGVRRKRGMENQVAIRRKGGRRREAYGVVYAVPCCGFTARMRGVMVCKRRMGNKVMSMRAEDKLI